MLLRKRIRQQGDNMTDFIKKTELSRSYFYNLMAGNVADPGVKTLYKLAAALNLPSVTLFRLFAGSKHGSSHFNAEHVALINTGDRAMFGADVNYPDYSMVTPGESFTKSWAIQNTGSIHWRERRLKRIDQEIVMSSRDESGFLSELNASPLRCAQTSVLIPDTGPGETVTIDVDFVAPQEQASVASMWRMVDAQGKAVFARSFYLGVVVTVVGD
jgi:transcriptional regulator with XRE-family HTH domain